MQLHQGLLLAAVLSLPLAQAMWCHQCQGFGGCSRAFRCPRDSTHCTTIATRPWTLSPTAPPPAWRSGPPPSSLARPHLPDSAITIQHHCPREVLHGVLPKSAAVRAGGPSYLPSLPVLASPQ
ncbi:secreted Ly-6/uPAR domain-containing protein 2 isoform X1 [Callithrix jacchus]